MIDKYVALNRSIRTVTVMIRELMDVDFQEGEGAGKASLITILSRSLSDLERALPKEIDASPIPEIRLGITKDDRSVYWTILETHIPALEDDIDDYFLKQPYGDISYGILDLLHPRVTAASYALFKGGNYRDAVLNSSIAVFDYIRERTKLDLDGAELIARAFSLQNPMLIFSTLETESGKNEQKGYIQILQGLYLGIRNPKAHSLSSDLDKIDAAQRLVFSSMLCRKIEESNLV